MAPKCPCAWGLDCRRYEKVLAGKGHKRYRRGIKGRIRIVYNPKSPIYLALRAAIHFHFGVSEEVQSQNKEYYIARHHFHPDLLDYLLDDDRFGLSTNLTTALPASVAHQAGIQGKLNMHPDSPTSANDTNATLYFAVPNYGKLKVDALVKQTKLHQEQTTMKPVANKRTAQAALSESNREFERSVKKSLVSAKLSSDASKFQTRPPTKSKVEHVLQQSSQALVDSVREQYSDAEDCEVTDGMRASIRVLYALPEGCKGKAPFQLPDNAWLVHCPGHPKGTGPCELATIRRCFKLESLCGKCAGRKRNEAKRVKLKAATGDARVQPGSHANMRYDSPNARSRRAANLRKERKSLKATIKRLNCMKERLSEERISVRAVDFSEVRCAEKTAIRTDVSCGPPSGLRQY